MNAGNRILITTRGSLVAVTIILTVLVCNVLQTLSIIIKPFSPEIFRKINRIIADTWWRYSIFCTIHICGHRFIATGDTLPPDENAFVISNHLQMPDILTIASVAYKYKRCGDLKWFVKDILKYVPGIGWGMLFLDCIFLKRNWMSDKDKIQNTFATLLYYKVPVWLVSFPEGTRLTPEKLEKSQAFAKKNNLLPTNNVLSPRTKGFTAALSGLQNHIHAIYDITIGYEILPPKLSAFYLRLKTTVHINIKRFPIQAIPTEELAQAKWLQERFYEKDKLLATFKKNKHF